MLAVSQPSRAYALTVPTTFQSGLKLGARATPHVVEQAEPSFHVLKQSGKTDGGVPHELAPTVASWAEALHQKKI